MTFRVCTLTHFSAGTGTVHLETAARVAAFDAQIHSPALASAQQKELFLIAFREKVAPADKSAVEDIVSHALTECVLESLYLHSQSQLMVIYAIF